MSAARQRGGGPYILIWVQTLSPMHRCFGVEDVVELFVQSCCDPSLRYCSIELRHGIIALARASRVFYEAAMNTLWRELDAVDLIRILGQDTAVLEESALADTAVLDVKVRSNHNNSW